MYHLNFPKGYNHITGAPIIYSPSKYNCSEQKAEQNDFRSVTGTSASATDGLPVGLNGPEQLKARSRLDRSQCKAGFTLGCSAAAVRQARQCKAGEPSPPRLPGSGGAASASSDGRRPVSRDGTGAGGPTTI